jgi:hypothetical protein
LPRKKRKTGSLRKRTWNSCATGVNWPTKSNTLSTHGLIAEAFNRTESSLFHRPTLKIASRVAQCSAEMTSKVDDLVNIKKTASDLKDNFAGKTFFAPIEVHFTL